MKLDEGRGAAESSKSRGETGQSLEFTGQHSVSEEKIKRHQGKTFSVDVLPMNAHAHCHMNIYMRFTAQLIYLRKKREGLVMF